MLSISLSHKRQTNGGQAKRNEVKEKQLDDIIMHEGSNTVQNNTIQLPLILLYLQSVQRLIIPKCIHLNGTHAVV